MLNSRARRNLRRMESERLGSSSGTPQREASAKSGLWRSSLRSSRALRWGGVRSDTLLLSSLKEEKEMGGALAVGSV